MCDFTLSKQRSKKNSGYREKLFTLVSRGSFGPPHVRLVGWLVWVIVGESREVGEQGR